VTSGGAQVLLSGNRLDAVVGPAEPQTTLGAVKAAWEAEFGAGTVAGLAPAAASAEVLGRELALATENVAKWLYESVGQGAGHRAAQFFDTEQRSPSALIPVLVLRLAQSAARLAAEQDRWRLIRPAGRRRRGLHGSTFNCLRWQARRRQGAGGRPSNWILMPAVRSAG
jgi:hypothetical protein